MNEDERRLQAQREELARQLQREEMARMEARRAHEAALRNREAANRCANNDGPAAINGLCVACYAAARDAEARTANGIDRAMVTAILRDVDLALGDLGRPRPSRDRPLAEPTAPAPAPTEDPVELAAQYARNLDQIPEAKRLWEQAVKDASGGVRFEQARAEFWRLVNENTDPDAAYLRRMLDAAGFTRGAGTAAPVLTLGWSDGREGRLRNARTLSIDHEVPRTRDAQLVLDSGNLRFMLMDDNLRRGAHFGRNDVPYNAERADAHRRGEEQRTLEAAQVNREVANRCVNNDGPAVAGGLCLGCFATMRAAEAAAAGNEYTQRIYELMAQHARKLQ